MGFVYQNRFRCEVGGFCLPLVGFIRCPDLGIENIGGTVLDDPGGRRRNTVALTAVPNHFEPVKLFVAEKAIREPGFKHPVGVRAFHLPV